MGRTDDRRPGGRGGRRRQARQPDAPDAGRDRGRRRVNSAPWHTITTTNGHDHDHEGHDARPRGVTTARGGAGRGRAGSPGGRSRSRRCGSTATPSCGCAPTRSRSSTTSSTRSSERMIAVMHDAEGIGLAATQVGILRRFFVCTLEGEDRLFVNPVRHASRQRTRGATRRAASRSGRCASPSSVPRRSRSRRRTPTGRRCALELEGYPARIVQHEVDHLDGKLMLDRTDADSGARRSAGSAPASSSPSGWSDRGGRDRAVRGGRARAARGDHEVAALLTRPDAPAGRGDGRVPAGEGRRRAARIPVLQPGRPNAGLELGAATVVVCAYGLLIPPAFSPSGSGSTSIRRCFRGGAEPRRSSGRSWPGTGKRV